MGLESAFTGKTKLTEHVALLVLTRLLARNVPLDAQPDHGRVLHGILGQVQPSDHAESATVVNVIGQALELRPKSWKREVIGVSITTV